MRYQNALGAGLGVDLPEVAFRAVFLRQDKRQTPAVGAPLEVSRRRGGQSRLGENLFEAQFPLAQQRRVDGQHGQEKKQQRQLRARR